MRGFFVVVLALVGLAAVTPPETFDNGFDANGVTAAAVTRSTDPGEIAKRSHKRLQFEGAVAPLIDAPSIDAPLIDAPLIDRVGNLTTPSTARGPEVTTPGEAEAFEGLPQLNEPPPTLYTTTTTAGPQSDAERRGFSALEQISYDWETQLPGWTIIFSPGRAGVLGYTYVESQTIEIFVRGNQSESLLAHVIAHELGHAVDVAKNSGDDRRAWQEARGISSADWWPGNGANDFSTGAGDFAESFAAWQIGSANFRSNLGGPPTSSQLNLMAELAAS